jgi:hypothetical protein
VSTVERAADGQRHQLSIVATAGGEYKLDALRHRAAHFAVTELSTRPMLYFALRTLTGTQDALCVGPATEIVIEGFPRSASSTTVREFRERQSRPVEVAHHKHHAAQLLRGIGQGLPSVMLIRSPADAIQSFVALAAEGFVREGRRDRRAFLTFEDFAWAWIQFYSPLIPHRGALVVGHFEEVTRDVPGLIRRVNERFGTCFGIERQRKVAPDLGYHALPNPLRSELKREIKTSFNARLRRSPRLGRLLDDCRRIYDAFDHSRQS